MATATSMGPRRAGPLPREVSRDAERNGEHESPHDLSKHEELAALRDENKELRQLVIQLSKLVIRNVMDHK